MQPSVRRFVALAAVAFAVYGEAVSAAPQNQLKPRPPAPQAMSTVQGELLQVDVKAGTVAIKTASAEMKFRYDDDTRITGARNGITGLAAKAGSPVTVQYRMDRPHNVAISIDVHQPRR